MSTRLNSGQPTNRPGVISVDPVDYGLNAEWVVGYRFNDLLTIIIFTVKSVNCNGLEIGDTHESDFRVIRK